ncbi:D-tyrosyl-tRNA(Tyr) deacylase [Acinetobacter qingfengensis]|uniref:D-aminoacyl-tRNA deacylase n=1 Tax=Acinetobacter qingfengensis TaxID=1262585 RepID=A0A1E7R538_9GAMM|nr:D-aminoacyl-tRNA deacylase [Acinetobacter qingfengensis]KAA8732392.1 D-tyrosyl-tRNA(Tyr) deacylase [Acinetobacter qingfengensis]OEY94387.1 D-tyrosyl-tRNA(Tyr) deacylase [Acinetobacter qingfengensis]
MRALIQRSKAASVTVDQQIVGQIQHGLVVFLGLGQDDNLEKGQKLLDKILKYRVFDDEKGKMGLNIQQAQGEILLVSQFTLYANTQKGLRPDFAPAMPPQQAKALYEQLVAYINSQYTHVATGIFAADMQVQLINDGPVTFMLEVE